MEHAPICNCPICNPKLYDEPEDLPEIIKLEGIIYHLKWIQIDYSDGDIGGDPYWTIRGFQVNNPQKYIDLPEYHWRLCKHG